MQLTEYLSKRLEKRRILLMTHAVIGYPSLEDNLAMLEAMGEAGVDMVELQMPFSEPTAAVSYTHLTLPTILRV